MILSPRHEPRRRRPPASSPIAVVSSSLSSRQAFAAGVVAAVSQALAADDNRRTLLPRVASLDLLLTSGSRLVKKRTRSSSSPTAAAAPCRQAFSPSSSASTTSSVRAEPSMSSPLSDSDNKADWQSSRREDLWVSEPTVQSASPNCSTAVRRQAAKKDEAFTPDTTFYEDLVTTHLPRTPGQRRRLSDAADFEVPGEGKSLAGEVLVAESSESSSSVLVADSTNWGKQQCTPEAPMRKTSSSEIELNCPPFIPNTDAAVGGTGALISGDEAPTVEVDVIPVTPTQSRLAMLRTKLWIFVRNLSSLSSTTSGPESVVCDNLTSSSSTVFCGATTRLDRAAVLLPRGAVVPADEAINSDTSEHQNEALDEVETSLLPIRSERPHTYRNSQQSDYSKRSSTTPFRIPGVSSLMDVRHAASEEPYSQPPPLSQLRPPTPSPTPTRLVSLFLISLGLIVLGALLTVAFYPHPRPPTPTPTPTPHIVDVVRPVSRDTPLVISNVGLVEKFHPKVNAASVEDEVEQESSESGEDTLLMTKTRVTKELDGAVPPLSRILLVEDVRGTLFRLDWVSEKLLWASPITTPEEEELAMPVTYRYPQATPSNTQDASLITFQDTCETHLKEQGFDEDDDYDDLEELDLGLEASMRAARLVATVENQIVYVDYSGEVVPLGLSVDEILEQSPFKTPLFPQVFLTGSQERSVQPIQLSDGKPLFNKHQPPCDLCDRCIAPSPLTSLKEQFDPFPMSSPDSNKPGEPFDEEVQVDIARTTWTVKAVDALTHDEIWKFTLTSLSSVHESSFDMDSSSIDVCSESVFGLVWSTERFDCLRAQVDQSLKQSVEIDGERLEINVCGLHDAILAPGLCPQDPRFRKRLMGKYSFPYPIMNVYSLRPLDPSPLSLSPPSLTLSAVNKRRPLPLNSALPPSLVRSLHRHIVGCAAALTKKDVSSIAATAVSSDVSLIPSPQRHVHRYKYAPSSSTRLSNDDQKKALVETLLVTTAKRSTTAETVVPVHTYPQVISAVPNLDVRAQQRDTLLLTLPSEPTAPEIIVSKSAHNVADVSTVMVSVDLTGPPLRFDFVTIGVGVSLASFLFTIGWCAHGLSGNTETPAPEGEGEEKEKEKEKEKESQDGSPSSTGSAIRQPTPRELFHHDVSQVSDTCCDDNDRVVENVVDAATRTTAATKKRSRRLSLSPVGGTTRLAASEVSTHGDQDNDSLTRRRAGTFSAARSPGKPTYWNRLVDYWSGDSKRDDTVPTVGEVLNADSWLPKIPERTPRSSDCQTPCSDTRQPESCLPADSPLRQFVENGRFSRTFTDACIVGKGGFGVVYKVRHRLEPGNTSYALKMVKLEVDAYDEIFAQRRSFREVTANRDLFSKYVVRYFTWWCEEPQFLPTQHVQAFTTSIRRSPSTNFLPMETRPPASTSLFHSRAVMEQKHPSTSATHVDAPLTQSSSQVPASYLRGANEPKPHQWATYIQEQCLNIVRRPQLGSATIARDNTSDDESSIKQRRHSCVPSSSCDNHCSSSSSSSSSSKGWRQTRTLVIASNDSSDIIFQEEGVSVAKPLSTSSSSAVKNEGISSPASSAASVAKVKSTEPRPPSKTMLVLMFQMEWCSGQTLRQWLDSPGRTLPPLDLDDCTCDLRNDSSVCTCYLPWMNYFECPKKDRIELSLFKQLMKGIRDIHRKGIVHRDLKPDNIFVDEESLKIGDFGLARFVEAHDGDGTQGDGSERWHAGSNASLSPQQNNRAGQSLVSRKGQLIGTPGYVAPEGGGNCSEKVDIYTAALILLELLSPRFKTVFERLKSLEAFRNDQTLPEFFDLPPYTGWQSLMLAMTNKDPTMRPSAQTILKILKTCSTHHNTRGFRLDPTLTQNLLQQELEENRRSGGAQ
eukprot:Blabericola_migrator_1__1445@NODE_137_length_13158_cov_138_292491_g119_i0_p1_GENE_NODE_137_length_13158_cov_138_292491_g119_i0NODE_137_length_13158_cov_138_292491_g119_i0_p1_ORF_typecomplete_len1875_score333_90Pkinase/PF00069_25/2_7e05Pkinase/PF00069_25/2_7e30Pkinase_Tyr/PF07714_17/0_0071Pkinase_Tyr/PF07714_17/4_7e24Kdo/PF06293_14/2e08Pkinase_fungal/PF17667_1/7_8e06WaaY/PF06176_11/1_1e05FTA2/PF13095_6/5FTA2/PF13095_6/0_0046Kinaselike/PF14531_6/5_5e05APH/PF01636_23/0_00013RIO1/PF01163_22/0_00026Y